MTLKKLSYTQTNTIAWSGDAQQSTDIDRNGLITQIDVTVEVTPSATLAGANQPDGPFRVVQNLAVAGGSHTYFTLPADDRCGGGILLHYLNVADGFGLGHSTAGISAPNRTYMPINYVLHAGSRPMLPAMGRMVDNKFDLTAFIPAWLESQLRATWTTSGNDVMDDVVTISSATMRFTLHVVQGSDADIRAEMVRQGVPGSGMVPAWSQEVFSHSATASDYATERDVPSGGFLKRIAIIEQDATATRAVRAQDQVTGVAVKFPQQNETLVRVYVDHLTGHMPSGSFLEADDAALDGGQHNPAGIFIIDLRPYAKASMGELYGLDLNGVGTGAVKLGFSIATYASGDQSLILYERYHRYDGPLAPSSR